MSKIQLFMIGSFPVLLFFFVLIILQIIRFYQLTVLFETGISRCLEILKVYTDCPVVSSVLRENKARIMLKNGKMSGSGTIIAPGLFDFAEQ